eukprot:scaffold34660_cov175-Amphora_coffeaeformis.AAC.6
MVWYGTIPCLMYSYAATNCTIGPPDRWRQHQLKQWTTVLVRDSIGMTVTQNAVAMSVDSILAIIEG